MEETSSAEHAKDRMPSETDLNSVKKFREGERAKLARALDRQLRVAKREARRTADPSLRLKWVNTVCYLTQTYNSLLRDTEVDELRDEMTVLQEKVKKISQSRHQKPQTESGTS